MIQFHSVSLVYEKGRRALDDVSFSISEGEAVGLIGANGAGKSTLMKAVLGLLPFSGEITACGMRVEKQNLREIRKKLGYVLQNSDNQMFMPTVMEDMMFGPLNYGMSREDAEAEAARVLDELGIADLRTRHNHRISGGEKRMAAIAAVMAMRPEVLLMDEPTSALDPFNRRTVINAIRGLSCTRIIASHDLDMILDTCSRVILLSGGRIAADGDAETILTDRALLEANRMELPLRFQGR